MRLFGRCNLAAENKKLARDACGNVQLCAGLQSGIEGNLHAMRRVWPQSAGWTKDSGLRGSTVLNHTLDAAEGQMAPAEEGATGSPPSNEDEEDDGSTSIRRILGTNRVSDLAVRLLMRRMPSKFSSATSHSGRFITAGTRVADSSSIDTATIT